MALKEKIPCPRCDAKGVIPRYYYNRKGLCFLCYGEKYIYVRVPEGQDRAKVIAAMKAKEKAHLDNHPPKVAMPDKMRNKGFEDAKERKAFGGGKDEPSEDPKPEPKPEPKPDPKPEPKPEPEKKPGHTLPQQHQDSIRDQLSRRTARKLEETAKAVETLLARQGDRMDENNKDHYLFTLSVVKEILQAKEDKKKPKPKKAKPAPKAPTKGDPIEMDIAKRFPLDKALVRAGISEADPQKAYVEAVKLSGMDADARAIQRIQTRADRTAKLYGDSPTLWAARILAQTAEAKPLRPEGKKDFDRMMRLTKDEIQDRVQELKKGLETSNKTVADLEKAGKLDKGTQSILDLTKEHVEDLQTEMVEAQNILGLRALEDKEYNKVADQKEPSDFDVRSEVMAEFTGPDGTKRLLEEFQEKSKKYKTYRGFRQKHLTTPAEQFKERVLIDRLIKGGRLSDPADKEAFYNEIKGVDSLDGVDSSVNKDLFERAGIGVEREADAIELGRMMMEDIEKTKPASLIALEKEAKEAKEEVKRLKAAEDAAIAEYLRLLDSGDRVAAQAYKATELEPTRDRLVPVEVKATNLEVPLLKAQGVHRMNRLRKYREFGNVELQFENKKAKGAADWAQSGTDFVPKDWLETSQSKSKLIPATSGGSRSYFQHGMKPDGSPETSIVMTSNADVATAAHELMHYVEWGNPGVVALEKEFFYRRAGDSKPVWRDKGYFYEANLPHEYMNKAYPSNRSFELMTVGIQMIMGDPEMAHLYEKDPDYTQFILGTLLGGHA